MCRFVFFVLKLCICLTQMNKDSQPKKTDEAATRSDSSKVGDVFPSTSLEEYANKSGRVSGIIGHGSVSNHAREDDDASEPESDEDHIGDDEHDLREDSDTHESSQQEK